ncbi:probable serine/threonine-protein kinase DDB_G0280133 [Scaptodrosophila lebanonensis]|uniref:Probable serine/threonine-protein kinase DDB_G0280133 n=1 Tax=Drosophila lebanonensis TaxID=7225 RepID=A0A6J2TH48_DROLE|nr:probable serine/threonine-protein kinase DDB_G0280133 [Scaptodrosophila lebanonensis]
MHFWIDKRSQQCGFGRSRVAASLSHAGNGLSYCHPPRRSKSSSNHSSGAGVSNSTNSQTQVLPSVHRSQAQQYQLGSSDGLAGSSARHYSNNNIPQSQNYISQLNNNSAGTVISTPASNNNHTSIATSSAAVLTGSGTVVPMTTRSNHHSMRCQPRQQQHQHRQLPQQHQQHLQYSYHHPQFGNMAVRHHTNGSYSYDSQQQYRQQQQHYQQLQQHHGVNAEATYSPCHTSSSTTSTRQTTVHVTPHRHNSSNNMRHSTEPITAVPPQNTAVSGNNNILQQPRHAVLQHTDSQLLPSHLKCGMCASLALASLFVGGAKFYIDHQGTGLEVLIFCIFSATFFLAACTISLCRIPKSLITSHTDLHAVCRNGVAASTSGSYVRGQENNDMQYQDDRPTATIATTATAATVGPPPYHIAILLPEQTQAGLEISLDESPPPSYDKILI